MRFLFNPHSLEGPLSPPDDKLRGSDDDWAKTQTVPPTNIIISGTHSAGVTVRLTPIKYKEHGGGYQIGCRNLATSPETPEIERFPIRYPHTLNNGKNTNEVTALSLRPGQQHECAVRTFTPPHAGQRSGLWSDWSSSFTYTPQIKLLDLHIDAFDSNLNKHRVEILQSIQTITAIDPEKVVVALVDGATTTPSTIQTITGTQIITTPSDDTAIYLIYGDKSELIAGKEQMNGQINDAPKGLPKLDNSWGDAQEEFMTELTHNLVLTLSHRLKNGEFVSASLEEVNSIDRLTEYNMANPLQMGAFIKWARTTFETVGTNGEKKTRTNITIIAHGIPLAPALPASNMENDKWFAKNPIDSLTAATFLTSTFPLPSKQDITPGSLTDQRSASIISPYALAEALRIGTNNGSDPLAVLDIVHCFGATIEELYELSNPAGKPFTEVIVGSPNYAYAGPLVVEYGLKAVTPEQSAEEMGESITKAYDDALKIADESDDGVNIVVEHPRVIISTRSSPIITLTLKINTLSAILLERMQEGTSIEASRVVSALEKAHRNSTHYDTTFCSVDNRPQDWQLNPEDALSDLAVFMYKLKAELIDMPNVVKAIDDIHAWLQVAVIGTPIRVSGTPYYAENPTTWTFDDPTIDDPEIKRTVGIGLYTDFVGFDITREDAIVQNILGWQAYWYSTGTPKRYAFAEGDYTWAHVFTRYWEIKQADNNQSLKLFACNVDTPLIQHIRRIYLPSIHN